MRLHALVCLTAVVCTQAYADMEAPHNPIKTFEQDRLTQIEHSNQLRDQQIYGIRTMQPAGWNTALEARLKAIEAKALPSNPIPTPACSTIKSNTSRTNTLLCPAGQAVTGFTTDNGKIVSAQCCPFR